MHRIMPKMHRIAWRPRSSAFVVASVAMHNFTALCVTLGTARITFVTRLNPLWIFAAAAPLGLPGWA
jgi:hypothetical protein